MELILSREDPARHAGRALVVGCCEDEVSRHPLLRGMDAAADELLDRIAGQREFTGTANKTLLIHTWGRLPTERLLLVGLGPRRELSPERLRQGAGVAAQALRATGIGEFASVLHRAAADDAASLRATAEGFLLGSYTFTPYKSDPAEGRLEGVTFLCGPETGPEGSAALEETRLVCEAVAFSRDLVSQPGNVATPAYLAEKALEMAGRTGIHCCILDREEMERNGMEAILAVGKGSRLAPRFIVLEYWGGTKDGRPVVLVGKGVTFDSGGISLKPREGMEKMKSDMAGGAAVMGALQAAATLGLHVNLVGLIPAAENLPDGGAYKPGDIVRTMAGKSVEIVNTDAEGRLLLCDALHYAQRYRPAALIDVATLTGACIIALGSHASGLMGNDGGLKRALQRAGEATGERLWELPLWEEYGELMRSDVADLKNAGGPTAGTISAGWFLKAFAGKARWAHLDIAGTAWEEKGRPYLPKGATGVGVRLLVEYLRETLAVRPTSPPA